MSGRTNRELVDVRPIRTVIHLSDAADPERRGEIAGSFVPTPEALQVLRTVLGAMASRKGEGLFVQGPYGSGKSHLLSYLGMAVETGPARAAVADDPAVAGHLARVSPGSWVVCALPLVDHPARVSLERLVAAAVSAAFERRGLAPPPAPGEDRRAWLDALKGGMAGARLDGLLLLVDELSEFLRAKPDSRAFAEDIRFLQFLGEHAASIPAVIAAGVQEAVDETGPIAQDAMAKIKDRYPHRFVLTADHVGELVRRRILTPRPGARAQVDAIHRRLQACLPHWALDAGSFRDLYPVHPATLSFLEQLKPLFSQHRGVVDFLVTRLLGSPDRDLPALLDAPAGTLLTVDLILDHFRERIRERIETAPVVDEVLAWWDQNLEGLFPRPEERQIAGRAIKVLALASLFPFERPVSVREMAQILLVSVTDLEPALNDHLVADVLDRMVSRGAYVARRDPSGPDALEASYVMRRGADAALVLRARARELAAGLVARGDEVLRAVTTAVNAEHLPLATLSAQGRNKRSVAWQGTLREGWVTLGDPWTLSPEDRDAIAREVATSEVDFYLFLVPPWMASEHEASAPGGRGGASGAAPGPPSPPGPIRPGPAGPADRLPPELAALPLLAWTPLALEDPGFLADARARQLLGRRLVTEAVPRSKELRAALEPMLEDDRRRLTELATRAYFGGSILGPLGPVSGALGGGLPKLEQLLETVVHRLLEQRYPQHFTVAPTGATLGRPRLAELVEAFLRPGGIAPPQVPGPALRSLLEGYLSTLHLARRAAGNAWQLKVDLARSPAAAHLIEAAGDDPVAVEELYWRFRKGPLGMTRPSFEVLLVSLIFSGHLVPFSQGRRMGLARVQAQSLDRVTQVARETPLPAEAVPALLELPFLSAKLAHQPPGPALTRAIWDEVMRLRSRDVAGLTGLAARLQHARLEPLLAHLPLEEAGAALDEFMRLLGQLRTDTDARDGLVELHRAISAAGLTGRLRAVRPVLQFLERDAEPFVAITAYLGQDDLDVPADPRSGPLCMRLQALRAQAASPSTCLDADALAAFRKEHELFLEAYVAAYVEDHQARRSPAALAGHGRVAASSTWRFLEALCGSPLVVPPVGLLRIRASLDTAARLTCTRLTPFVLRTRPTCVCGHRFGEVPAVPEVAQIQTWLDQALRDVLAQLAAPERARELARARAKCEEWGQTQEAAILDELTQLAPDRPDLAERLSRLAGAPVQKVLAQASGHQQAPIRDLDRLAERLAGKILTAAQVVRIVREWLGDDLADGAAVRIPRQGQPQPLPESSSDLDGWPGARDLAARHGVRDAVAAALLAHWASCHGVPATAAARSAHLRAIDDATAIDWSGLSALGADLTARGADRQVDEIVFAWEQDGTADRLFDLVGHAAGPSRIHRALEAEPLFPGLARRLAGLALRALAAGAAAGEPARPPAGTRAALAPFKDVVRGAAQLAARLDELSRRRGRKATTAAGWEERFQRIADLPVLASAIEAAAADVGLVAELGSTGIAGALRDLLRSEAGAFEAIYRDQAPTIWTGDSGPLWPHRVVVPRLARLAREHAAPATALVLVDAMRWDFHRRLEADYLATPRAGMRRVALDCVWALAPTTTATNVTALLSGQPPPPGPSLTGPVDEEDCRVVAVPPPPASGPAGLAVVKLDHLDEQLHASALPLARLYDGVAAGIVARLAGVVSDLRAGSLLAVVADHGFVEEPGWRPHAGGRRYRHGGLDPFEVLVPLAVYQKL
jgi:hypothetical protein